MRKIIILTLTLVLLISTVCFAAVSSSGSRSSSSSSKSSFSAPSGSSSSIKSTSPSDTSGTYKPSAPANSFGDKAPAQQTPGVQSNNQTQSSTGGFWRNASMIGGGFLAGSLLGNMFGFGNNMGMGGMSSLFGMLINILIIGGIVMLGRNLWDKYQNKDKDRYK
jgi:uncharacterized protein YdeI (BOF family)